VLLLTSSSNISISENFKPGLNFFIGIGSSDLKFSSPRGVAIWQPNAHGEEHIVIADSLNHRIIICNKEGNLERKIEPGEGARPGQLNQPSWLAIQENEIFVSDRGNHRIQVFDAIYGTFLRSIGKGKGRGQGELLNPNGLVVEKKTSVCL